MAKFRKLPVEVEAVQWFKDGDIDAVVSMGTPLPTKRIRNCRHCDNPIQEHGRIKTLEGWHFVCPGDWIVTGVEKEQYPVKDSIFKKTYEAVIDV